MLYASCNISHKNNILNCKLDYIQGFVFVSDTTKEVRDQWPVINLDTTIPTPKKLPVLARDTSGQPGDSIRIVYDSTGMAIDTIRNDSTVSKPLFNDHL